MAAYLLTRDDYIAHLHEQIEFMRASSASFDAGFEGEGKRLATVLRLLLHDTPQSASLLGQIGIKEDLDYLDTALPINPRNLVATPGLVIMRSTFRVGGKYVAPLGDPGHPAPPQTKAFHPWWTAPVTKDARGETFARRDYVLKLSNKEGGAHVDHKLDARYAALSRENSLGFAYMELDARGVETSAAFEGNPALPSVRQIAYEVEHTLQEQLGYLLDPPDDPVEAALPTRLLARMGRNDPCPCGSGKKFKRCHGA